jgi:hypothetical protein
MGQIMERSFKFKMGLDDPVAPYTEILKDFRKRRKQRKIIDFVKSK